MIWKANRRRRHRRRSLPLPIEAGRWLPVIIASRTRFDRPVRAFLYFPVAPIRFSPLEVWSTPTSLIAIPRSFRNSCHHHCHCCHRRRRRRCHHCHRRRRRCLPLPIEANRCLPVIIASRTRFDRPARTFLDLPAAPIHSSPSNAWPTPTSHTALPRPIHNPYNSLRFPSHSKVPPPSQGPKTSKDSERNTCGRQ